MLTRKYYKEKTITKSYKEWTNTYTVCHSIKKVYLRIINPNKEIDFKVFFSLDKFNDVSKYVWKVKGGSKIISTGGSIAYLTQAILGLSVKNGSRVRRIDGNERNYLTENLSNRLVGGSVKQLKIRKCEVNVQKENSTLDYSSQALDNFPAIKQSTPVVKEAKPAHNSTYQEVYLLKVVSELRPNLKEYVFRSEEELLITLRKYIELDLANSYISISKKTYEKICESKTIYDFLKERTGGV